MDEQLRMVEEEISRIRGRLARGEIDEKAAAQEAKDFAVQTLAAYGTSAQF